jgi:hypothetical protein
MTIREQTAWPATMLMRRPKDRFEIHPVFNTPDPWASDPNAVDDDKWRLIDGMPTPSCQRPAAAYVYLSPFLGRLCRNPAFAALRVHHLIPPGTGYKHWLDPFTYVSSGVRYIDAPRWCLNAGGNRIPANASARFQAQLEAAFLEGKASADAVLSTMALMAEAIGMPFDRADELHNDLALLLQSPWQRVMAPQRTMVRVLKLPGRVSPESLITTVGGFDVDLYNLGTQHVALAQVDPDVAQADFDRVRAGVLSAHAERRG